ncbi:MAG TPA: SMC family ATPase [Vicinamibacteria bacterium]|nr:SMC family ATPase [Vicinamibacteria bacterium]
MRPTRLELEGFTAYREYTVLDFEGAELFVLTGPTGSGKSSLIDAMTFALYGSVARYGNPNLVHPVISQGKLEARVRFDFALGDDRFSAVRVVRRGLRGGATTREARLESNGRVLAGSAEEVTRKVRELLGLNFDQFTTCVVLPQGEFARFLHEKPAERQDLLTKLLGVEVYERMGALARTREAVAKQTAQLHSDELGRIGDVSVKARKKARLRVRELERLGATIDAALPELEMLARQAAQYEAEAREKEHEAELLDALVVPKRAESLAVELDRAETALEKARADHASAQDALRNAQAERDRLPSSVTIHGAESARAGMAQVQERLALSRTQSEDKRTSAETLAARLSQCVEDERAARERVEAARGDHAAHVLALRLKKGEPCPVCSHRIEELPKRRLPPQLADLGKLLKKITSEREKMERDSREAEARALLARERVQGLEKEVRDLERRLAEAPSASECEEASRADASLENARAQASQALAREEHARQALESLSRDVADGWAELEKARDRVAFLQPPPTDRESLGKSWTTLHDWARAAAPSRREIATEARAQSQRLSRERGAKLSSLKAACNELGLPSEEERLRDVVVNALVEARHALAQIVEISSRAHRLRREIRAERERAEIAGSLGQHLKATGFERWLLKEAFRRLAEGATVILKELSSGQYSFEYDDRLNFEVIDHRNADERRSARTLSGGETFLASLALALTLAEQTTELAASGSVPLESLFLDEGFGTLDNDTLEVVAAAIQELGARGRIVGLVTHQENLAEQIPVQFRVSKGPATSTVEKVVL